MVDMDAARYRQLAPAYREIRDVPALALLACANDPHWRSRRFDNFRLARAIELQ